ncbi:hypothetical protein M231_06852 [Tremella mesenterica]|uniref:Endonuclease/exonuclease/phosphatase domain-containing protein n=1 Tax=Tremella mesenterica TaxID=5217 RepID=A0A4Q1BAS3_TREME|nr:hypothetical protein M231_06852 [Tremella mesenterica]
MVTVSSSRSSTPSDSEPLKSTRAPIHLATLNIKFDGDRDHPVPIPPHGAVPPSKKFFRGPYDQLPWAERRSRMVDALLSLGDLDIVAFQEVYKNQLDDIQTLLGPEYSHVGVGRDDGIEAGEYSPIFYDSTRFELLKWTTKWLSTTPDKPSKGWDAGNISFHNLPRIMTLLSLKDRFRGLVHVVNTHWDDLGFRARAESGLMMRQEIWRWVRGIDENEQIGKGVVILLGDLNSPPEEEGYKNLTSTHGIPGQSTFTFLDTQSHLRTRPNGRQSNPYGPLHTYTGFSRTERTKRIDFIFLASDQDLPAFPPVPLQEHVTIDDGEKSSDKVSSAREGRLISKQVISTGKTRIRGGYQIDTYAVIDNFVDGDVTGWRGLWSDHRAVRVTISF